jgi:diguanylate cyclase (GGDEF)-like protein
MKASDTNRVGGTNRTHVPCGPSPVRATSTVVPVAPVTPPASIVELQSVLGFAPDELQPRVRDAFLGLLREVEGLRAQLAHATAQLTDLEKVADTDTLSPIANRRAFVRELSRMMAYAERYEITTSLLFFDLNGLKQINDTHGHAAGDAVLVHTAHILQENIRGSDLVGRLGGDEYAVILNNVSEAQANLKAEQLLEAISTTPVKYEGSEFMISSAVGAYTFGPGETPAQVIQRADEAMYKHKRALRKER